jgi:signal transduction histidine kinase/CheY-like chemotaxis protein
MQINSPEEEARLTKIRVRIVAAATISVVLILLYVGIQSFVVFQALEKSYGIEIKSVSSEVNILEQLFDAKISLTRAQVAIGQHAAKLLPTDELAATIDSAAGLFYYFDASNPIGAWMSRFQSFQPAYAAVQNHLALASAYSRGENNLPQVYEAYAEAASKWTLLASDVAVLGSISNLRRITKQTLSIIAWMMGLCIVILIFAVYAGMRLSRESVGQFNRIKLLAVTIGHDFKSPMASIDMAGAFLRGDLSAEDRAKYTAWIFRSTQTMARLLDDVLNVTLRSKVSIKSVPTNISLWAENMSLISKQKAVNKGLGWHMHCNVNTIDTVTIDPDRLTQVVGNLVENAIHYTDFGAISLSVALGINNNGAAMLTIQVDDTGPGISDLNRKRIFEPFERITTNKEAPIGMGLGLTIVTNLVTAMGGRVAMTSQVGQGSSFKVSIPTTISLSELPFKETKNEPEFKDSAPPNPNAEILVVDDDEAILSLVADILREAGYVVDVARSGEEAWDMVQSQAYRLVLTDIQMPGISGIELTRRIRKFSNVVVIGMSAGINLAELANDSRLMNALISKPFSPDDLFKALKPFNDKL